MQLISLEDWKVLRTGQNKTASKVLHGSKKELEQDSMTFLKIDSMKRDMNFKHAMILHIKNSGVLHAKLSSQLTKLKSKLVLFQYSLLKKKVNFKILVMQKLQEIVMVLKPFTQLATKEMMLAYQLL